MDVSNRADYFLQPRQTSHPRYEVVRAVFAEQESMRDVARQFNVSYGTVRNWVSEFCRCLDAGDDPPFFPKSIEVGHRSTPIVKSRRSQSLTFRHSHWNRAGDSSRDTPASSSFCHCWRGCGLIEWSPRQQHPEAA